MQKTIQLLNFLIQKATLPPMNTNDAMAYAKLVSEVEAEVKSLQPPAESIDDGTGQ